MRILGILPLLLLAAGPAAAGDLTERGNLVLEQDLVVDEGDTLHLEAGSLVTGDGRLIVHGRLLTKGTPEAPVRIAVQVLLDGPSDSMLAGTRFLGAPGVALDVRNGAASLTDVRFDGSGSGLRAEDASLTLRNVRFRDVRGVALEAVGGARVHAEDVAFSTSAVGLRANLTQKGLVAVANGTFVGNGRAAEVSATGDVAFTRALFSGRGDDGATASRALVLVYGTLVAEAEPPVRFVAPRFLASGVCLAVSGEGRLAFVRDAAFDGCGVGVLASGATARVEGATFRGRGFDVAEESGGAVEVSGAPVRARDAASDAAEPAQGVGYALVVGVAVAAAAAGSVGAWFVARPRAPAERDEATPEAPKVGPEDLLGPTERRIFEAIRDGPGRAQADVAASLGLSRQALHYHVKKLERAGFVVKAQRGRETLCYPAGHPDVADEPR